MVSVTLREHEQNTYTEHQREYRLKNDNKQTNKTTTITTKYEESFQDLGDRNKKAKLCIFTASEEEKKDHGVKVF